MAAGSIVIDLLMKTGAFETDTKRAEASLKRFQKQAQDTGKKIGQAMAVGATVAVAAITKWTGDVMRLSDEIDRFSKLTGSSAQEFQKWAAGASSVGLSQEKLADQLKDFREKVGEFMQTGGGGMKDFFEQIAPRVGVTAEAFRDLSGPQGLQLYYDSLQKAGLSQEQMSFYLESMASDTTALIPLLKDGGAGFKEWGDMAERAGAILDGKTMEATREFRKQMAELDLILTGVKIEVAQGVLPAMGNFAKLLSSSEFRDGFQTIIQGAVTATSKLLEFATTTANVTRFLAEEAAARIHGANSDDLIRLEAQADRLKKKIDNFGSARFRLGDSNDPLAKMLGIGGKDESLEELNAQYGRTLSQIVTARHEMEQAAIKAAQAGVAPTAAELSVGIPKPNFPTGTTGDGKGKGRELPDFGKEARAELEALIAKTADARARFDAWAAQLAGPVAEANYQYAIDLERLNELARTGEVSTGELAAAQSKLREEHEKNIAVLEAQLTPAEEALRMLEEETAWLKANEEGQLRLAAARMLGADATREQIDAAVEQMRVNEQLAESLENWDQVNRNISDTLFDVVTGAESAMDAVKGFFDDLNRQILRNITDDWADSITGWLKNLGNSSGGNEGGGWLSTIGTFFSSFGGGKAGGGDVLSDRAYLIGERGPEMFIPRTAGTIIPAQQTAALTGAGGRSVNVTHVWNNPVMHDRRSESQRAAEASKRQREAARNA